MSDVILRAEHLRKYFPDGHAVQALDDFSGEIRAGEILGVVGESGSGKSTLARAVTRLTDVDAGHIWLCGREITRLRGGALRACYRQMQMVFQDAAGSFDPRLPIGRSIAESLENFSELSRQGRAEEVARLLESVGLEAGLAGRLPARLSGGECQRAAIAKAIAVKPRLLICDEATSALDVSMQAQIVELIARLARELNLAVLFISHDLALVDSLCSRVMVMYRGRVIEEGPAREVIRSPREAYTRQLRASVFPVPRQA